jgi:hypothetical protein
MVTLASTTILLVKMVPSARNAMASWHSTVILTTLSLYLSRPNLKMKGVLMALGTVPAVMAPLVKRLISAPTAVLEALVTGV